SRPLRWKLTAIIMPTPLHYGLITAAVSPRNIHDQDLQAGNGSSSASLFSNSQQPPPPAWPPDLVRIIRPRARSPPALASSLLRRATVPRGRQVAGGSA